MSSGRHIKLGKAGEELAAQILSDHGFSVLDRNWRDSNRGELDIVARDPESHETVIVEVKTRIGSLFGTGFESVDPRKYRRLCKLAHVWCFGHRVAHNGFRIDIISVTIPWSHSARDQNVEKLMEKARVEWFRAVTP